MPGCVVFPADVRVVEVPPREPGPVTVRLLSAVCRRPHQLPHPGQGSCSTHPQQRHPYEMLQSVQHCPLLDSLQCVCVSCAGEPRAEHSTPKCGLCSVDQRERTISFDLLEMGLLVPPGHLYPVLQGQVSGVCSSGCPPGPPGPLAKPLSSWAAPSTSQCRALRFPVLSCGSL